MEYKLHLTTLDDGRVICVSGNQAVILTKAAQNAAALLLSAFDKDYVVPVSARSVELAEKANGEVRIYKYKITDTLVRVLGDIAPAKEPVTISEVATLCGLPDKSAGVNLSKLTGNGLAVRVGHGKYRATPEGHDFLRQAR